MALCVNNPSDEPAPARPGMRAPEAGGSSEAELGGRVAHLRRLRRRRGSWRGATSAYAGPNPLPTCR
ncbi:hypothetical protein E2562_021381 [Oryza meyeriana var. granulata]|uniref:Uncharacterized protein n=1 Tax=Oryza meyeriana var. granulata TaxID=110450 RepID=A0A6G1EXI4_9ORYZ|nr:hypothetical protein E2562_021381 [Oryza meyeriana var. granulata]